MPHSRVSLRMTMSDLAKYSMTRSTRGLSATAELFVLYVNSVVTI